MSQKKYVSLSKLSTFLDNLKNLFATKTSLDELSIDVAYINSTDNENITDVDEEQSSSSIKENIGVEILNKKINNLENAISPLLVIDKVDDKTALFKQTPEGVLPYAYLNKLGDNCIAYYFSSNLIDFKKTFVVDENGILRTNTDMAYLMSDGRVKLSSTVDAVTSETREIHVTAKEMTTETFIYPPSTYSSLRRTIVPNSYGSNDTSITATTYFVAYGLMSNSLINIDEDTYIAEPFIIKEFVIKLEYYANDAYDIAVILDTNLSFGSKTLDFTPYAEPTLLFNAPSEVVTIDGYGSAGNYIDFDRKVYVRASHNDEIDVSQCLSDDNMIEVETGGIILFQPASWTRAGLNIEVLNELMSWAQFPYFSEITYKKEIFFNGFATVGTSWGDITDVVRSGLGKFIFPVGYEFTMKDQITGNDLVWVVRGHDNHKAADSNLKHSMTIELKDVLSADTGLYYKVPFDAKEALYYVEEGLNAGTYHFTVADHLHENDNGKTFQFTLKNDVPAGSQLILSLPYPEASLNNHTLIVECNRALCNLDEEWTHAFEHESTTLSVGNEGTNLGITGQGNFNHINRATSGSSNYAQSAVRQWLNNNKNGALGWWKKQTKFDISPETIHENFVVHLPEEFLEIVQEAEIPCISNGVYEIASSDFNGELLSQYYVKDKFFLLSMTEVYSGYYEQEATGGSLKDGEGLDFYNGLSHSERIKYDLAGRARGAWLRTPSLNYPYAAKYIDSRDGIAYGTVSYHTGIGVTPACIIA